MRLLLPALLPALLLHAFQPIPQSAHRWPRSGRSKHASTTTAAPETTLLEDGRKVNVFPDDESIAAHIV